MGLQTTQGSTVYLTIQGGFIARRVPEPTAYSKTRQLESGKVINEELYGSIEGHITGISTKEGTYGKELHIQFADDTKYDLQVPLSSGPAKSFLSALPNLDLTKMTKLIPKREEKDGVARTKILLSQNNAGVKWAFTKDNPGDMPPMKKIKVKGKETWDDTDQLEFFEALVTKYNDKLKAHGTLAIGAEADDDQPF
jgi:hypothetical protein